MSRHARFVGTSELPWDEGTYRGPDAHVDDAHVDYQNGRWSLTGLSKDHMLFSAVSLQVAGLDHDPVELYWAEQNLPQHDAPYLVDVGKLILAGLPEPFSHVLFACPIDHAAGLTRHLDRLSFRFPTGVVVDSVHQVVPVVDWKLLEARAVAPPKPPTVRVHLYGLQFPDVEVLWRAPRDPWREPVALTSRARPKPKKEGDDGR